MGKNVDIIILNQAVHIFLLTLDKPVGMYMQQYVSLLSVV